MQIKAWNWKIYQKVKTHTRLQNQAHSNIGGDTRPRALWWVFVNKVCSHGICEPMCI